MTAVDLSAFYPAHQSKIKSGLMYVAEFALRDARTGQILPWTVERRFPVIKGKPTDLRQATYWLPEQPALRNLMRRHVDDWLNTDKALSAKYIKGEPRTREEFARFAVEYRYDQPRTEPRQPKHAEKLGDVQVDDTVRLSMLDEARRILYVERANYLDQVATNIQADKSFETPGLALQGKTSFRELDAENGDLKPLNECHQANTIGVACLLMDRDGIPLMVQRSPDTAVMNVAGKLHCSSSGALAWSDMIDPQQPDRLDPEGPARGMAREIHEELGLVRGEHFELEPLMLARELPRAGKPQFFFLARSSLGRAELQASIKGHLLDENSIGGWEIDPTDKNMLVRVMKNQNVPKGGLFFDQTLKLSSELRGNLKSRCKGMTYEGFAALWYAAATMGA